MAVSFDNSIGEEGSQQKLSVLDYLQSAGLRQQGQKTWMHYFPAALQGRGMITETLPSIVMDRENKKGGYVCQSQKCSP